MLRKQGLLIIAVVTALVMGTGVGYAADEQPPAGLRAAGKITGIDLGGSTFTMETLRKGELTVVVTGTTEFRSPGGEVQGLEDLETGMPVVVGGQLNSDGDLLANVVGVARPGALASRFRARGEITNVAPSDGVFTLRTRADEELEIHVSEQTRFLSRDGDIQGIEDLEVGMLAQVQGVKGPAVQLNALRVAAGSPEDRPGIRAMGQISAIGDDSFTLETRQGRSITFEVDESTKYRSRDGRVTSFDDLEVGMKAAVAGDQIAGGAYKAVVVGVGAPQDTSDGSPQAAPPGPGGPGV
jgi:hypothetical protein